MIGRCGAYCGVCEWKEPTGCPGCQACAGKPFWGECFMALCSIGKGYLHCGECAEVPCERLTEAFNDAEHGDKGERLINLKNWSQGKEEFLVLRSLKNDSVGSDHADLV